MRKFLFILLFFFISASAVHAEIIRNFTSDIKTNKDGTITVQENVTYDFEYSTHHGIYRDIPYKKVSKDGKTYRLDFDVQSVEDESGHSWNYETSRTDENIRIKIGDANKYVSGIQVYVITYKVSGVLTYFSDHDELYWNVTGNEWSVPIEHAAVTLTLPQAVEVKTACFTGSTGSTESACEVENNKNITTITSKRIFGGGEGMSVVVGFPKNIVAVLEPKAVVDFGDTLLGKVVGFGIILGLIWWYFIYPLWLPIKWYLYGRDPSTGSGPVSAWFDPPKGKNSRFLTPGETGALVDERVDMRDMQAMIVDLARRGYLKIAELKKDEWHLQKTKTSDNKLQPYESSFLSDLFDDGEDVNLKEKNLFKIFTDVQKKLYQSVVDEGFFPQNPGKVRAYYNVIIGLAGVMFNIPLVISAYIFGHNMVKKTISGAQQANVARSLKNFLSSQERQLEFQAKNQMFFEKLLPYAIAFGVEKVWADRFADMNFTPTTWYYSYTNVHSNVFWFSQHYGSSFGMQFQYRVSTTSSSSGFSSGFSGGSSGGGGGGGGGGSW